MILCDLCGEARRCRPREIEGKEYSICSDCWTPLAAKLKGKGRAPKERETILLPRPQISMPEPKELEPMPGGPPKIWSRARKMQ
jgi:hypothetical protein